MADEIIKIVPDGDIVLTVSKGNETLRFLVESAQLCAASDVFKVLLSPKFAEGQALAAKPTSPCEVQLHDDAPFCMQMILDAIHFRFDRIPERINGEMVLDLAVMIDKYFLNRAMKPATDRLLFPLPSDDLHAFLRAAVTLDDFKAFREITRLMILHQAKSNTRKKNVAQDAFVQNVHGRIDEKRATITMQVFRELRCVASIDNETTCKHAHFVAFLHIQALNTLDRKLSWSTHTSLSDMFEASTSAFHFDTELPRRAKCRSKSHYHPKLSQIEDGFMTRIDGLKNFSGLCLDCEKRNFNNVRSGKCQFGHARWVQW